jgi:enamine deaminase RidA (YjgF/YER057c/UK114 family)
MSHRVVNPPHLAVPIGFAHGVKVGNTVHLGGQTAMDAEGKIVPGGVLEQFKRSFQNVLDTLAEAGGKPSDLVSVTIYLTDVDDYQKNGREIGRLWRQLAGTEYPAMAGVGVTRLWQKEAVIEISAIAVIED